MGLSKLKVVNYSEHLLFLHFLSHSVKNFPCFLLGNHPSLTFNSCDLISTTPLQSWAQIGLSQLSHPYSLSIVIDLGWAEGPFLVSKHHIPDSCLAIVGRVVLPPQVGKLRRAKVQSLADTLRTGGESLSKKEITGVGEQR